MSIAVADYNRPIRLTNLVLATSSALPPVLCCPALRAPVPARRRDRCEASRGPRASLAAKLGCVRLPGFVAELCVLRTFEGVDFSLMFICAQSIPEFLWDRLRASIQFHVMPKRAHYARFSGEGGRWNHALGTMHGETIREPWVMGKPGNHRINNRGYD